MFRGHFWNPFSGGRTWGGVTERETVAGERASFSLRDLHPTGRATRINSALVQKTVGARRRPLEHQGTRSSRAPPQHHTHSPPAPPHTPPLHSPPQPPHTAPPAPHTLPPSTTHSPSALSSPSPPSSSEHTGTRRRVHAEQLFKISLQC